MKLNLFGFLYDKNAPQAEKSSKSEVSTDDAPINPSQFSNTTGQSHMLFYYNDYYYCYCYCLKYTLHSESRI